MRSLRERKRNRAPRRRAPIRALGLGGVLGAALLGADAQAQPPPLPGEPPVPSEPPVSTEPVPEERAAGVEPGRYGAGNARLSLLLGAGSAGGDGYMILGAGAEYFALPGLALGLGYEAWLIGDPSLHRLSPGVRYVFYFVPHVQPYVGTFYRHTFVSDFEDLDSLGARGGIHFTPEGNVVLGAGLVYERQLGCDDDTFIDCDTVYPELSFAVAL